VLTGIGTQSMQVSTRRVWKLVTGLTSRPGEVTASTWPRSQTTGLAISCLHQLPSLVISFFWMTSPYSLLHVLLLYSYICPNVLRDIRSQSDPLLPTAHNSSNSIYGLEKLITHSEFLPVYLQVASTFVVGLPSTRRSAARYA